MSTNTTTIRVPVQTRDRLAAQARQRGVSVSSLLSELAAQAEREAIFSAERDDARTAASSAVARDEDRDWDVVLGDGLGDGLA